MTQFTFIDYFILNGEWPIDIHKIKKSTRKNSFFCVNSKMGNIFFLFSSAHLKCMKKKFEKYCNFFRVPFRTGWYFIIISFSERKKDTEVFVYTVQERKGKNDTTGVNSRKKPTTHSTGKTDSFFFLWNNAVWLVAFRFILRSHIVIDNNNHHHERICSIWNSFHFGFEWSHTFIFYYIWLKIKKPLSNRARFNSLCNNCLFYLCRSQNEFLINWEAVKSTKHEIWVSG